MRTPICRSRSDSVEEAQRLLVPARRGGRGAGGRRGSDAEQQVDRRLVSRARGLRDVVGALGRRRASLGERVGCACMRREAPPRRHRLVHGPPHQRMAEDEEPRDGRGTHEVQCEQRVERDQSVTSSGSPATAAARSGSNGSPATAAPFSSARSVGMDRLELLDERGGDGRRHDASDRRCSGRRVDRRGPATHARELLEVERIATALAVDRGGCARVEVAEQERGLLLAETLENDPPECRDRERRGEVPGRLRRAEGERDEHASTRRTAQQRRKERQGSLVGPVEVIEDEHERALLRQQLEQSAHGAVGPVALVGDRPGGGSAA